MNRKTKIYIEFIICFLVCMTLYILSTYLKEYTEQIFQSGIKYWIIEFVLLVIMSLLNGSIFEHLNKRIIEQPDRIFEMMKFLILQLYSFSIILLCIMLVVSGFEDGETFLTEERIEINVVVFLIYIIYIFINKKKKKERYTLADAMKVIISASIIFQSSLAEILFLGMYILLLYIFSKINLLYNHKTKFLISVIGIAIFLLVICVLISSLSILNKIVLSITSVYMLYMAKADYNYLKNIK